MLHMVYNTTSKQDFAVKVASPVGTLIGQVVFGWLADKLGRKRMSVLGVHRIMLANAGALAGMASS